MDSLKWLVLLALAALWFFAGCSCVDDSSANRKAIITAQEAMSFYKTGSVFVDATPSWMGSKERIPKVISFEDVWDWGFLREHEDRGIVIYGHSSGRIATHLMREEGMYNIYILSSGYTKCGRLSDDGLWLWKMEGYPVEEIAR